MYPTLRCRCDDKCDQQVVDRHLWQLSVSMDHFHYHQRLQFLIINGHRKVVCFYSYICLCRTSESPKTRNRNWKSSRSIWREKVRYTMRWSSLGVVSSLPDQVIFRYLYTSKFNKNSTRRSALQPMSDSKSIKEADCVEKRE